VKATGRWRSAGFCVVMLAAAAVAAHSLMLADGPAAAGARGDSTAQQAPGSAPEDTGPVGAGAHPIWPETTDVESALAKWEFVFVVLPGPDEGSVAELRAPMEAATDRIEARKVSVGTVVLERGSSLLAETVEALGTPPLPAVVAVTSAGSAVPVEGEITEDSLLRAYLTSCASPGCCSTPGDEGADGFEPMDPPGL
jgi:hypothetical protein